MLRDCERSKRHPHPKLLSQDRTAMECILRPCAPTRSLSSRYALLANISHAVRFQSTASATRPTQESSGQKWATSLCRHITDLPQRQKTAGCSRCAVLVRANQDFTQTPGPPKVLHCPSPALTWTHSNMLNSAGLQGVTQPPATPAIPPAKFGFVENAERINSRAAMVRFAC